MPTAEKIIDVRAGESTLADDLLAAGYENISVLDVSQTAIDMTRKRLGARSDLVEWGIADVLRAELPAKHYAVWHDRAVFHFLAGEADRATCVRQVMSAVESGGHVIMAAFGPQGPERCSGLNVVRYDERSLQHEFGSRFRPLEGTMELHQTPVGTIQHFLYCCCKIE